MIALNNEKIKEEDINSLCDWLKTNPRLTQDVLCKEFEEKFAEYIGVNHAVFVNSGSSANLLALSYLSRKSDSKGKTVIIPAVSWATDYSPVVQLGFNPVLVDCNLKDLNCDLEDLERVFSLYKPLAYLHVSVLGHPGEILEVKRLCEKYNVILIEDNCESLGSEYNGVKLGNFGLMSTYSFYYSHHISTIEGGMICTNDKYTYNILRMLREHGWARSCETWFKEGLSYTDDDKFKFYELGYNVRNTEIAAFIGLEQLNNFKERKYKEVNSVEYTEPGWRHKNLVGFENPYGNLPGVVSSFGIPVLVKDKVEIDSKLSEAEIEYRPIIAGSMEFQPMVKNPRECKNAKVVHQHGIYLPNHTEVTLQDIRRYKKVLKGEIWSE